MKKDRSDAEFRPAMRDLIGTRWGNLWKAVPAAIEGTNIDGVHDVRVASRRLRAAMDVSVDAFPEEWFLKLHERAKEITAALGSVRDLDVLIENLGRKRNAAPPEEHPGFDILLNRLRLEREVAREEMLAFLTGIEEAGVAEETFRRFGPAATAPWLAEDSSR